MKNLLLAVYAAIFLMTQNLMGQNILDFQNQGSYNLIAQSGGPTLGLSPESGVKIISKDNLLFKDLNKNGELDTYEDWRLPVNQRAADLATKLSIEQIAGLMLYSSHQSIPARSGGYFAGTYNGKPYEEGVTDPTLLTDQQKKFIKDDNLRHVLLTTVQSPEVAAKWNNNMQAYCESLGLGIPANNSSDPRHGTIANMEYNAAAGGKISMWPSSLGMAATFNPELLRKFGTIASKEYRALGIATALSPQIDMATEPRWARFDGTFGESSKLAAAMAEAYCDGFQNSENGWGMNSVNAMVKHWPGGGSGEAGRDAHYGAGKFAVYPGGNFEEHKIPFTEGAFMLKGETKKAAAVMPYYTISWNMTSENIGNGYNAEIVANMLRKEQNYDGVLCTDWSVTHDHNVLDNFIDGKPWGVESLTEAERHYLCLKAGIDQFGGNNDMKPILEAYQMGIEEMGEAKMRARMEESARRLLKNIIQVGLFENPYVNPEETKEEVGNPTYMQEGFEAQLKSVVMLKNSGNVLPLKNKPMVYMPKRLIPASVNFLGMRTPEREEYTIAPTLLSKYFDFTENPDEADFAIVAINNPSTGIGYDKSDLEKGGNGYFPISLQYDEYKAKYARKKSIAGGDPLEDFTNRSYRNKTVKASNYMDADLVKNTKEKMGDKPVILSVKTGNPLIFSEIEKYADAILVDFGVQYQAILEILAGNAEPSAMLPMQMPADMKTVELQFEDVPFDMNCYKDSEGNTYDFGFGLNWSGKITDGRAGLYR
ncbi:glycoside hydrolase family 3 protein [Jiulongibacter sediminis]|nr:glycoside hydrolase family 3 N-terminal domain-containing protein [Jiulongibacter sediminis]TBX25367.1 beta-glucosidase [Jiulongibacter sediminis]